MNHLPLPKRARGFGMFDAVVSLALLGFGMLALTRFEGRLGSVAAESAQRSTAGVLADELLNAMLTDNGNPNCYTLPVVTPCANANARAATNAWKVRVMARLPNAVAPTVTLNDPAAGRVRVRLSWSKDGSEFRVHEVQSDFR